MIDAIRHPYRYRHTSPIKWSKDYGCYIRFIGLEAPKEFFLGERWLYWTPGEDTNCANLRGNLCDDWPCIDFGKDLKTALEWLSQAEEPAWTEYFWVKQ